MDAHFFKLRVHYVECMPVCSVIRSLLTYTTDVFVCSTNWMQTPSDCLPCVYICIYDTIYARIVYVRIFHIYIHTATTLILARKKNIYPWTLLIRKFKTSIAIMYFFFQDRIYIFYIHTNTYTPTYTHIHTRGYKCSNL